MKKKLGWCLALILLVSVTLLAISCGGAPAPAPTPTPAEEAPPPPPPPAPAPAPVPTSTAIPHTLEGRADCLLCHASGAYAVPADHAGRTSDTCTGCHQPAGY